MIDSEEEEKISSHSEQKGDPFRALIKTSNSHELTTLEKDPIRELGNYIHENCLAVDLVKFSSAIDILSYSVISNSLEAQKYFKRKNLKKLNESVENIVKSINEFRDCIYGFSYIKRSFDQNDLEKLIDNVYILFKGYKSKYVEREDKINSNLEIEWSVRKSYIESIVAKITKEKDNKSTSKRTKGLLISGISKIAKQITQGFSRNLQAITDGSSQQSEKSMNSSSPVSDREEDQSLPKLVFHEKWNSSYGEGDGEGHGDEHGEGHGDKHGEGHVMKSKLGSILFTTATVAGVVAYVVKPNVVKEKVEDTVCKGIKLFENYC